MFVVQINAQDHRDSLVLATACVHVDVQGLCTTGPVPYWLWRSGELAPPLTSENSPESRMCASAGQHIGAGSGSRDANVDAPTLRAKTQEGHHCHSSP